MGGVTCVISKQVLGGAGGYDFKGGGREQRSLCGEGGRVGDGLTGW